MRRRWACDGHNEHHARTSAQCRFHERGALPGAAAIRLGRFAAHTPSASTRTETCIRVATQLHRGSPRDAVCAARRNGGGLPFAEQLKAHGVHRCLGGPVRRDVALGVVGERRANGLWLGCACLRGVRPLEAGAGQFALGRDTYLPGRHCLERYHALGAHRCRRRTSNLSSSAVGNFMIGRRKSRWLVTSLPGD
jgi:hypothetical protein